MGRPRRFVSGPMLLTAASLCITACTDADADGATTAFTITSVEPAQFVAYRSTEFTVHGTGFARTAGPADITSGVTAAAEPVLVTFVADEDTPFANGTAGEVQIACTVVSDTELRGTLPPTNTPGEWMASITVADALGSATTAT